MSTSGGSKDAPEDRFKSLLITEDLRQCPNCKKVGNYALCGPHTSGAPICETVPVEDEEAQTAHLLGGIYAGAEVLKEKLGLLEGEDE